MICGEIWNCYTFRNIVKGTYSHACNTIGLRGIECSFEVRQSEHTNCLSKITTDLQSAEYTKSMKITINNDVTTNGSVWIEVRLKVSNPI